MKKLSRPKSLTEITLDNLRDSIVDGDLKMGDAISEKGIAEELGISKTPVREAMLRLKSEGLVEILPQKGTFVFTPNEQEVKNICDLRVPLESTALQFSMRRNPKAMVKALGSVVASMKKVWAKEDYKAYLKLDTAFHQCFIDHCDNPYIQEAYKLISSKMAVLRVQLGDDYEHMEKSFDEHQKILDVLSDGDLDAALAVLEGHIARKEGSYWLEAEKISNV